MRLLLSLSLPVLSSPSLTPSHPQPRRASHCYSHWKLLILLTINNRCQPGRNGSPTLREAHWKDLHRHGSRSFAGGLIVCVREAQQGGRPCDQYTVRYMEAGPCRRPCCIHLGSPTLREAHCKDPHTHGSRSMPEALLCVEGKPDTAGGPTIIC